MSEIASTPAPVVTESAVTSTADVAANVIDSYEQSSDDGTGDGDGIAVAVEAGPPVTETASAEPPAVKEPPKVEASPEDAEIEALLSEFGFKEARKPDGREHYIPRSKVLKMIGSGLKRGQDKWTAERGVIESQAAQLREQFEEMRADILADDPTPLIAKLADYNPKFRQFLQPQAQPTQTPAVDDTEPQPDIDLGDGRWTYSQEQNDKRIEWKARKLLDERLKPWEEREKRAKEVEAQQKIARKFHSMMQEAQAWEGFGQLPADGTLTEFQQSVLEKLRADSETARKSGRRPSMTLREAYLEVRSERLSTDHNAVREQVLKDLQKAQGGSALPRQATDQPRTAGPVTTQDIAAKTLARLERGA